MWNKRKEEEYPPKSSATPAPAPTSQIKENAPMSTNPAPSYHPTESRGPAIIGKSVMIKGQIFSREDLTIDGEIDGSVELHEHRLTVGPNGKLQAGVKAREVVVLGTIHGNVEASDKIDIRKDAKLVGDIKTARIVIEDGAYFKGSIDIARPEAAAATRTPAPAQPKSQPATASSNAAPTPATAVAGDSR
jgi:cytoskeletal protein CcmA (bactofilin family)